MPAVPLLTRLTPLVNPFCRACFPQGGLTLGQALHVSVQVLTGLQHLHRLGVLHRDLRTSNILVEGRDPLHVLVADFGVSHVLRQLEGAAGTVGYEGLRLLSAGEAVHGLGAQGKWICASGLGGLAILMWQLGDKLVCLLFLVCICPH